jgi:hypothetical protein
MTRTDALLERIAIALELENEHLRQIASNTYDIGAMMTNIFEKKRTSELLKTLREMK